MQAVRFDRTPQTAGKRGTANLVARRSDAQAIDGPTLDAEADRHARERGERQHPRPATEENREAEAGGEQAEEPADELEHVRLRRDRREEHAGPERSEAECRHPLAPCLRDEQQREREARDRATEVRESDHFTNTAARST